MPDVGIDTLFMLPPSVGATYRPLSGGSQAVRVIHYQPIDSYALGGAGIVSAANVLKVRVEEVPVAPAAGDVFALEGRNLELVAQGVPLRGQQGKVWSVDVVEGS
jgi:hypothetical protein